MFFEQKKILAALPRAKRAYIYIYILVWTFWERVTENMNASTEKKTEEKGRAWMLLVERKWPRRHRLASPTVCTVHKMEHSFTRESFQKKTIHMSAWVQHWGAAREIGAGLWRSAWFGVGIKPLRKNCVTFFFHLDQIFYYRPWPCRA